MLDQITITIINSGDEDIRVTCDSPAANYMGQLFSVEGLVPAFPAVPFFPDDAADEGPIEIVETTALHPAASHPLAITIDPGYTFGDGRHATTWLCVKYLVERLAGVPERERARLSLLDAGTGTGVLAIVAAKLGIRDIDAIDIYHHAIQCAAGNCARNDCTSVRLHETDLAAFSPGRAYDIVMANLVSDVIIANMENLVRLAAPGGVIIASGVSAGKKDIVRNRFSEAGLHLVDHIQRDGWCGFFLRRP